MFESLKFYGVPLLTLYGLILSYLQITTDTFANSVDPDETARNELSHQDLHCLLYCFEVFTAPH